MPATELTVKAEMRRDLRSLAHGCYGSLELEAETV